MDVHVRLDADVLSDEAISTLCRQDAPRTAEPVPSSHRAPTVAALDDEAVDGWLDALRQAEASAYPSEGDDVNAP